MIVKKQLVFLDTESTGKDPITARIVELGLVFINMDGTQEKKRTYINPGIPIPPESTAIHNITDEMVADAPTFRSIAKALHKTLYECDLGGYNIDRYDIPLLSEEFARCNLIFPSPDAKILDGYRMELIHNSHKLGAVYQRLFNKPLEGAHGALTDTEASLEIFVEMLDRYYKPDITVDELHDILNGDIVRVDRESRLKINDAGELVWNFGPKNGEKVLDDLGLFNWVLTRDFISSETKQILIKHQKDKFDEQQNASPENSP